MVWPNVFGGIKKTFLGRLKSIRVDQSLFLKDCRQRARFGFHLCQQLAPRNRHISSKANVDVFARVALARVVGAAID